ncbi:hypothetical protein [Microbacterium sp. YY-01]|uniref:hypothetical protein n=1 Tax=Microbacterium sp. YY-01 TaxID=3421634 RepID=UPI003D16AE0E
MSSSSHWWRHDSRRWRSGPWTLELRDDELAEISVNNRMLVRSVRAVVRDNGWNTVPVRVLAVDDGADALRLELEHDGLGASIRSYLRVEREPDALVVTWEATNGANFDTCRTGLVVLHPPTDAGKPVRVEHSDGAITHGSLPIDISPHQPIFDIRELRIGDDTAHTTIRFAGDIFEMEDQRNWTDASLKTYSRPLALPFPYPLGAGERVMQSLRISGSDGAPHALSIADADGAESITVEDSGCLPTLGVEAATAPDPIPVTSIGSFRTVELNLATASWRAALERAARDRLPLDVRIVSDGSTAHLRSAAAALAAHNVVRVMVCETEWHISDAPLVAELRAALHEAGSTAAVWGGTRSHFTELNREFARVPADVDGIMCTVTPLFHSVDTEQLVESVAMQRLIARQIVRMAAGKPVHIGPVALRPRFNNVATRPQPLPTRSDLSQGYGAEFTGSVDHRQSAQELAAWTLASITALSVAGIDSLAYFETWGPRGLIDDTNQLTPAGDMLQQLSAHSGEPTASGCSTDGLVWALAVSPDSAPAITYVANLDRHERTVTVRNDGTDSAAVTVPAGGWVRVGRE